MKKVLIMLIVTSLMMPVFFVTPGFTKDKVQIVYWHQWTSQWTKVLNDIADMFNKSQDEIEVKAVCVPENFRERLMSSMAAGDVPDVVSLTGDGNLYMAEKGVLTPLDELMTPAEMKSLKDWAMPVVWQVNEWKGHIWALTPYIDVGSLYYNKKHFQEAGLNVNNPPLDIATLDQYAEKLTKYDARGNIDRIGFYPSWGLDFWGTVFGGKLVDDKGAPIFNKDPKIVKALEWIASYAKKFDVTKLTAFESGLSEERAGALDPFISQKKSMEQQGQWVIINIANYAPKDFSYGITKYAPCPPDGKKNAILVRSAYGALAIPKGAKHPKEGLKFALFWLGYGYEAQRAKIFEWGAWMPLDKKQKVWSYTQDYLNKYPQFKIFRNILFAQNWTIMKTPVDSFLFDRLSSARDYARLLKKTPQQALDDAAAEVMKEYERLESGK
ncbi:MAG: hypothetical protein ACP5JL_00210 [bacterium]